jgi:hypothetical protein
MHPVVMELPVRLVTFMESAVAVVVQYIVNLVRLVVLVVVAGRRARGQQLGRQD